LAWLDRMNERPSVQKTTMQALMAQATEAA
jgi:hypothetical protein